MKKIIGISGSNRKDSYNTMILENIKKNYSDIIDFEIVSIDKLPMYNQDIENDYFESVKELEERIINSDGVIIATPEHNYSVPALLKNAIDWMSRIESKPLKNKKIAILSASLSFLGGARVQYNLRNILLCLDSNVVKHPEVFIGEAYKKFNENRELIDENCIKSLNNLIEEFISEIK